MQILIQDYLLALSKKTVRLAELEGLSTPGCSYQKFAYDLHSYENLGVLVLEENSQPFFS